MDIELTQRINEYTASGYIENECIICGEKTVVILCEMKKIGVYITQEMQCLSCKAIWNNHYTLTIVTNVLTPNEDNEPCMD
jgi:hypothetical protein